MQTLKTSSGMEVSVVDISSTGCGVTDKDTWELRSAERLSDQEVEELIEKRKPSAGYGSSSWGRMPVDDAGNYVVRVSSWASCD